MSIVEEFFDTTRWSDEDEDVYPYYDDDESGERPDHEPSNDWSNYCE